MSAHDFAAMAERARAHERQIQEDIERTAAAPTEVVEVRNFSVVAQPMPTGAALIYTLPTGRQFAYPMKRGLSESLLRELERALAATEETHPNGAGS